MLGGPFPDNWMHKQVVIEIAGDSDFVGQVTSSNEGGCVVAREVIEEGNPDPTPRQYFYPWSSIRSIKLLEEPKGGATDELQKGSAWYLDHAPYKD